MGPSEFINDALLSKASRQRGLFRPKALKKIVSEPGVAERSLWGALSLELWHKNL